MRKTSDTFLTLLVVFLSIAGCIPVYADDDDDDVATSPTPSPTASPSPTPTPELRTDLTWDVEFTDMDVHLVFVTGTASGGTYGSYIWDCHHAVPEPSWGARLVDDDNDGFGPETIIGADLADGTYKVYVHYFSDNTHGPSTATVTIEHLGVVVHQDSQLLMTIDDAWAVAEIALPSGNVTPVDVLFESGVPPYP